MGDARQGQDSDTISEQNDYLQHEPDSPEEEILDPDPQDPNSISYNDGSHKIQCKELFALIGSHIKQFTADTPTPPDNKTTSRASHNAVQRAIWRELVAKAMADNSIPNALFDPPRTYIRVCVAAWPRSDHYCCPCDLDGVETHAIEIKAARDSLHGITKDIFLQKIAEALYGRDSGAESGITGPDQEVNYTIGGEEDRPIIDHLSYMSSGGSILGDIYALTWFFKEEEERDE